MEKYNHSSYKRFDGKGGGSVIKFGRTTTIIIAVLFIGLVITALNIWQLASLQAQHYQSEHAVPEGQPGSDRGQTYVVYAKHPDSGYLKHVYNVLERAGYRRANYNYSENWDVMWAHDYPFKKIREKMLAMKKGQKVNKFPGSGYITNKVNLATSGLKNVPPAFSIPKEKEKLLDYAKAFPDKLFVQKSNNHRGIQIQGLSQLDLNTAGSFVQEYIANPFLIDGHKFDIGIYTTVTSINPLRIYVHHSDALLRFCPEKYHPFDAANKNKYVVHDDYLPSWKIPSFSKYMSKQGFSFTDTLNTYIRSLGKDPERVWEEMYSTITEVYEKHEEMFIKAISHYPHKDAFFEMVRFDFVLDDELNVYLMEANMSPNLSSAHFPANKLLYEQVVHSLLRLVGVVQGSVRWDVLHPPGEEEKNMVVAEKDILTYPDTCASDQCSGLTACSNVECDLCLPCLSNDDKKMLKSAWLEQVNRHATRRIFPLPATRGGRTSDLRAASMTKVNRRMDRWFQGKCELDLNWCN